MAVEFAGSGPDAAGSGDGHGFAPVDGVAAAGVPAGIFP
jgi:hypothetical protein